MVPFKWNIWVIMVFFSIILSGCGRISSSAYPKPYGSEKIRGIETVSPTGPGLILGQYAGKIDSQGMITLEATGKGIAPDHAISPAQAQLMAERAAIADGYRKLAEKISGIYIQAFTRIGNETIDSDFIQIETDTWLRWADVMQITHIPGGVTEAKMKVRVHVASVYHRSYKWDFPHENSSPIIK